MKSLLPLIVLAIFLFGCVDIESCPEGWVCFHPTESSSISGNRTTENSSLAVGEAKTILFPSSHEENYAVRVNYSVLKYQNIPNNCGLEVDGVCQNETITKIDGNCIYSKDKYGNNFIRCEK